MIEARPKEGLRVVRLAETTNGEQTTDCETAAAAHAEAARPLHRQVLPGESIGFGANVRRGCSHDGKLLVASATNNHQSTAYNITPHPSQISVPPLRAHDAPPLHGKRRVAIAAGNCRGAQRSRARAFATESDRTSTAMTRGTLRALSSRIPRASLSSPSMRC